MQTDARYMGIEGKRDKEYRNLDESCTLFSLSELNKYSSKASDSEEPNKHLITAICTF
jgi:hypothetical protein